ncbi:MAG: hypothetical protein AMJ46_08495 [Latescibacteria bacterium DG_63]|nr:MAG: hypothetical protein AMJ46_08495 [Latescibacteria bacterium DG_63]
MSTVNRTSDSIAPIVTGNGDGVRYFRERRDGPELSACTFHLNEMTARQEEAISNLVSGCSFATVFHSTEWNRLLSSEFGLEPRVSIVSVDDKIVACNIFYVWSDRALLRASWSPPRMYEAVYGGPVFAPGLECAAEVLLKEQQRLSGACTTYVVTPPGFDSEILKRAKFSVRTAQTVTLGLRQSVDELWNGLGAKRRNMIRKARQEGVEVRSGFAEDMPEYHNLLCATLARGGKEPLRLSFFSRVAQELIPAGLASFLVAVRNRTIVAGALLLHYGISSVYWSGASSEEGKGLAANDIVQWHCILAAKERDSNVYDFLGIDTARLPGISAFKKGFGGAVVGYCSAIRRTFLGQAVRVVFHPRSPARIVWRKVAIDR